jgi:putative ABC transport system substrate-binding protein
LLREIAPQVVDVALLVNPKGTLAESQIKDAEAAVQALGQHLYVANASSESEIEEALVTMDRLKINALLVGVDPLFGFVLGKKIVALAARYNIPAMYDSRSYVASGGLISYGPVLPDTWRQAGIYVGRILKGDKPSDLPVVQPTKYELLINLKTAKTLGLTIPQTFLATADEVIE